MEGKQVVNYLIRVTKMRGHATLKFYLRFFYERRAFTDTARGIISVGKTKDGWELYINPPEGEVIIKDYRTIGGLKRALNRWMEREGRAYVFVKPSRYSESRERRWINLRHLANLTLDEYDSFKIIVARATGHLNTRMFIGVRLLGNTSKACRECGRKAELDAVYSFRGAKYSIPYCKICFIKTLRRSITEYINKFLERVEHNLKGRWEP